MNLVLEPGLNATWERFGLFRIGDPKIPSNDRADLIRPPGSSQFPDALKNRPDVPGELGGDRLLVLQCRHYVLFVGSNSRGSAAAGRRSRQGGLSRAAACWAAWPRLGSAI